MQLINDDDGNSHVGWKVPEQPDIGVEPTSRAVLANQRKVLLRRPGPVIS
jgi:hypothetical protein